ncbi:T9SS type A sorting domain-containing protein [Flavobacterium sp. J27]|uniref:T9SS type A sorting domain-containing protein n=1 Tax=Flavobacterium sp. J27 TaxID=2060419 RepID=UPI0010326A43|nr:T9SS type A sorting domain-containing protein [Flavobacterium sp. J27]
MKYKKTKFYFALLFGLGSVVTYGQQGTVSSGGDASGSGGGTSYSVGQIVYTTNFGTTGSVAQGVQQPYEIQTVLGSELFTINLNVAVYPNPTTDVLNLTIQQGAFSNLSYQLVDFNGRILASSLITSQDTTLLMSEYPKAIYLLNVVENNKIIKTFKIIKK